jgi:CHASE3 domain sensor protein
MKRITAYVNTTRVHWLVEELQAAGIGEIMVTEYFKPLSQVSRLELLCQDTEVVKVKGIIHRVGTMGGPPPDHDIIVRQHDPERLRLLPMSIRLDPLEESRIKQLIHNALNGVGRRLSFTFSVVALSIVCVALILHVRIEGVQYSAREANRNVRLITDATKQIQTAHLEQLLAAERLHRGDMTSSLQQFKNAGAKHEEAALVLKQSHLFEQTAVDSLVALESRFQSIVSSMFEIITSLDRVEEKNNPTEFARLSQSHDNIMTMLNALHLHSMAMLVSLEQTVSNLATRRENESDNALQAVRLSLTILAALAIVITVAMWLVARRKVSRPLHVLTEEAKTLDTEGLT